MNKKGIIIVLVLCIVNILFNFNSVLANSVPKVGISKPNKENIYIGESVVYYVTFENTNEVNFTEKDVGKAGDNVTLNKKVDKISTEGNKHIYKVTLSNIQGPENKLVSIAIRKGIAKNEYGVNEQSYKSYAFKIVKKPEPPKKEEVVIPQPPKQEENKVVENKEETKPINNVKEEKKKVNKPVNMVQENKEPIKDTTITETMNQILTSKIRVSKPYISKVSEGDIIKYNVEYSEEVKNINLTADKIETIGFTADVLIREYGRKRVVFLTNIKGEIGTGKNIIIKEDSENELPEVRNTPTFEIVPKDPIDNSDVIKIPFTGSK